MIFRRQRGQACPAFEARLEDYLEGRLEGRDAEAVESHARKCSDCGAALKHASNGASLLAVAFRGDAAAPGPFFAAKVMAAIRGERKQQEAWAPIEKAAWRLCWVATALALVLTVFMLRMQYAGPTLPAQQSQVQALVNVPPPQLTNDDSFLLVASDDNGR